MFLGRAASGTVSLLRSWAGSPEPVDSWQPNAGLIPRRGRGQKDGAYWAREEGRQKRAREEGREPKPEAPDGTGWAKEGTMTQWARRAARLRRRGPALEEPPACSINSGPWELEEVSPQGLLGPGNLPSWASASETTGVQRGITKASRQGWDCWLLAAALRRAEAFCL